MSNSGGGIRIQYCKLILSCLADNASPEISISATSKAGKSVHAKYSPYSHKFSSLCTNEVYLATL